MYVRAAACVLQMNDKYNIERTGVAWRLCV